MKMISFNRYLIFLFLLGAVTISQAQEHTKKFHEEIQVNPNALIEINNSFGDLNITSWDEDRVVIDVLISVFGKNSKKIEEKLNSIDVLFSLSPEKVMAETKINESWSFKWFSSSSLNYKIDYTIKLPRTSSVDLTNDYGTIRLNSLEGQAKISCDFGKMILGELHASNNELDFDYTSNSTIDFIKGGIINADYSDFEIEKAGQIELNADYTNSYFNSVTVLNFNNDFGKMNLENVAILKGKGDYLTLKCGIISEQLTLDNEFGLIQIKQINHSAKNIDIDTEYTSIQLGIDKDWSFTYEIDLEYTDLKSNFPLEHSVEKTNSTEKYYKGIYNQSSALSKLKITSEFGGVKLNLSN